jgi:hypothetical protein
MFTALDKLANQGIKQAIIVVPEKSIGSSFNDEKLTSSSFGRLDRSDQWSPKYPRNKAGSN